MWKINTKYYSIWSCSPASSISGLPSAFSTLARLNFSLNVIPMALIHKIYLLISNTANWSHSTFPHPFISLVIKTWYPSQHLIHATSSYNKGVTFPWKKAPEWALFLQSSLGILLFELMSGDQGQAKVWGLINSVFDVPVNNINALNHHSCWEVPTGKKRFVSNSAQNSTKICFQKHWIISRRSADSISPHSSTCS